MLKREIKYEDFNGEMVTEVFYFNISKPELIEMEVEYKGGFGNTIENIIKTKDNKGLVEIFKKLILLAYGEKSEDGKSFVKSDELREKFSQTAAYIQLFTELATNDNDGADFIIGIMPKDMGEAVKKAQAEASVAPPTPPTS